MHSAPRLVHLLHALKATPPVQDLARRRGAVDAISGLVAHDRRLTRAAHFSSATPSDEAGA
jgi:hypothetical protein